MANNKDFILKNGIDIRGNFNANNGLTVGLPFLFQPDYLFQNGENGAWYDPSDLSTLYQDSSGTIPVTDDGDPVGLMLDKSSNNNHASQSTAAARPVYRTDGTLHWLEFDGVDDFLETNTIDLSAASHLASFIAFEDKKTSKSESQMILATSNTIAQDRGLEIGKNLTVDSISRDFGIFQTETASDSARNIGILTSGWASPTKDVAFVKSKFDTSGGPDAIQARKSGVDLTLDFALAHDVNGTGPTQTFRIGARGNDSFYLEGKIFGIVMVGVDLATNAVEKTEHYLASKSGVNLQ